MHEVLISSKQAFLSGYVVCASHVEGLKQGVGAGRVAVGRRPAPPRAAPRRIGMMRPGRLARCGPRSAPPRVASRRLAPPRVASGRQTNVVSGLSRLLVPVTYFLVTRFSRGLNLYCDRPVLTSVARTRGAICAALRNSAHYTSLRDSGNTFLHNEIIRFRCINKTFSKASRFMPLLFSKNIFVIAF